MKRRCRVKYHPPIDEIIAQKCLAGLISTFTFKTSMRSGKLTLCATSHIITLTEDELLPRTTLWDISEPIQCGLIKKINTVSITLLPFLRRKKITKFIWEFKSKKLHSIIT